MIRIAALAALLLAAGGGAAQVPAPPAHLPAKGINMNTTQPDPAADLLRLPDDEYFSLAEAKRIRLADDFSQLVTAATPIPPGRLALGAPTRVNLTAARGFPVLLASFETGLRAWEVSFKPNLFLFAKSLSTGRLLKITPFQSARRKTRPPSSGAGPAPTGAQAEVTGVSLVKLDLTERLAGNLARGDVAITAVAFDVRSNTVRIQVDGPEASAWPVATRSGYVRSDLDARQVVDPEIVVPAAGSSARGFRIRVAQQVLAEAGILRTELNQPFLSAHLVLVRLDEPAIVIEASPMAQQVSLPNGTSAFNVLFLVELGGAQGHPVPVGDYRVYLDLGGRFVGPYGLKVS